MSNHTRSNQTVRLLIPVLLVLFVLPLLWSWQSAQANTSNDDNQATGIVQQMPATGLIGDWTIGDVVYRATASTEIEEDEGPLVVGACVKVEFSPGTSPLIALKLDTEPLGDCNDSATPDPDDTETPEPTTTVEGTTTATPSTTRTPGGTPDNKREAKGIVSKLPSPGLIGAWTIGGVDYVADASTEFEQDDGPFVVGACVEVEYFTGTTPLVAHEIKTESSDDCRNNGTATPSVTGTPPATPSATTTPGDEQEIYGRIDSFPASFLGDWVINGVTYLAESGAEFKPEHGAFAVGACVKVHIKTTSSPAAIREIETEHEFRCGSGGTSTPEAELYGVLQSFPTNLIGNWNIGGMTFVADSSTEFKQENGAFAVGMTVKVHFSTVDSVNRAREIETKYSNDDDGDDDDGNGSYEGAEGHAYSKIDSFPVDLIGAWTIGGVDYAANAQTQFEQSDGTFATGVKVKVEYYLDADGNRVAQKIETTNDDGGSSSSEHFKLFGFVTAMPPSGFVGQWVIDNIAFVSGDTSTFKEDDGLFGMGAFVAVEYFIQEGRNQIHEIETHVPPGAGSNSAIGIIDDQGGAQAASISPQSTWTINGRAYTVTPATDLNDTGGTLTVGATVLVNSYTALDGSQVATQIRSVTLDHQVLLPVVSR